MAVDEIRGNDDKPLTARPRRGIVTVRLQRTWPTIKQSEMHGGVADDAKMSRIAGLA